MNSSGQWGISVRLTILAASAALLTMAACEKAEDKAASQGGNKFDIQYCATESVDAPTHMPSAGCVISPNRQHILVMQSSGVIELADVTPSGEVGKVQWSSEPKGKKPDGATADLQEDGNLVIYEDQKPIWNSHTAGPRGRYTLTVTDPGNAIIKNPAGQPVWAALFDVSLCPSGVDSPAQLTASGCIISPDKHYAMVVKKTGSLEVVPVQPDGALGKNIWSSGNHLSGGGGAPFVALQDDGNLVVYVGGKPVWNAGSNGPAGKFHLELSNEGELKLHRADGAVIWSSKTGKVKA
jgi:hypothetical protein